MFFSKSFQSKQENISKEIKLCPIGEYQFSVNDLPENYFCNTIIPIIKCIYNEIVTHQHYKLVFLIQTPRAPPIRFS